VPGKIFRSKEEKVNVNFVILYNEEIHDSCRSPSIATVVKSMGLACD